MANQTQNKDYKSMLHNDPQGLLEILNTQILNGSASEDESEKILRAVSKLRSYGKQLLQEYRDTSFKDSLIHNAAKTCNESPVILKRLIKMCPDLLLIQRRGRFFGQTALHIVIAHGGLKNGKKADVTRDMLGAAVSKTVISELLSVKATGSAFGSTVMMGELALSIAALNLEQDLVDLLIINGAMIRQQNSKGDTVFHSLIRFATFHPDKIDSVIEMIKHINKTHGSNNMIGSVWYITNQDNLTALKFAAMLGQVKIFKAILELENVYWILNNHDGLFDNHLFDITEIDTTAQAEWEKYKMIEKSDIIEPFSTDQYHKPTLAHEYPAVLDILCHLKTETAIRLLDIEVVKHLVNKKWMHYSKFYYIWFVFHILMMILITVYAVYKTHVINNRIYYSPSTNSSIEKNDAFQTSSSVELFVYITSAINVLYAIPYVILEFVRTFYFLQPWHLGVIHHNGLYRFMMLAMAISLILDSIIFWVKPDNNYFLVVAILVGWTFVNFFLRASKIFSFFTVMLQKVLLFDMTRFSVIIIFQLIAFSVTMYITFLNTNPIPPGFNDFGTATMTIFKLMLGLTDIEVLYDARHRWLAILIFVGCVLVTYVLLLNSLIALMSQTCALISEDRKMQWELQRLSVLQLVETIVPPICRYPHQRMKKKNSRSIQYRCFYEMTSVSTTNDNWAMVTGRTAKIRPSEFDGNSGSPFVKSVIDKFRYGILSHPPDPFLWIPLDNDVAVKADKQKKSLEGERKNKDNKTRHGEVVERKNNTDRSSYMSDTDTGLSHGLARKQDTQEKSSGGEKQTKDYKTSHFETEGESLQMDPSSDMLHTTNTDLSHGLASTDTTVVDQIARAHAPRLPEISPPHQYTTW